MGIFNRGLHPFLDKCKTSLNIVERSIQLCLQDLSGHSDAHPVTLLYKVKGYLLYCYRTPVSKPHT